MKKKSFFWGIVISIMFSACQQNETVYSCNKDIDEWVHENLTEIRTLSRSTWNNLDENLKVPTYRAFTQQQKINFWNSKITEVLQMEWNEAETAHLNKILDFIKKNPFYFDTNKIITDEEQEAIDIFSYRWVEEAKTELGWDMPLIYAIVATGNTLLNKEGKIQTSVQSKATRSSGCECEIEQIIAWCLTSSCEESMIDCEPSDHGCGFLGIYKCNGTCGGI